MEEKRLEWRVGIWFWRKTIINARFFSVLLREAILFKSLNGEGTREHYSIISNTRFVLYYAAFSVRFAKLKERGEGSLRRRILATSSRTMQAAGPSCPE